MANANKMFFSVLVLNNENNPVNRGYIEVSAEMKSTDIFRELRRQNFVTRNFAIDIVWKNGIAIVTMSGLINDDGQKIWNCDSVEICYLKRILPATRKAAA